MGCQATFQFQILFLFLSIAAVKANDCNLRELLVNINAPPTETSIREPDPSLIHQHHDNPLEAGSGSYSTAESSSQGQYHIM